MKTKIIIPLVILATLLPAIGIISSFGEQIPTPHKPQSIPETDKIVSILDSDRVLYTMPELVKTADLIIVGQVTSVEPYEKMVDPQHDSPWLFTLATVQIQEILKGQTDQKTVKVQLMGGESDTQVSLYDRLDVKPNETFVLFLSKSPTSTSTSMYGDNYSVTSTINGLYVIDGDTAKAYEELNSLPLDGLKLSIALLNVVYSLSCIIGGVFNLPLCIF